MRNRCSAAATSSSDQSGPSARSSISASRRSRCRSSTRSRFSATWTSSSAARNRTWRSVSGPAARSNGAPARTTAVVGSPISTSSVGRSKGPLNSPRCSRAGSMTKAERADVTAMSSADGDSRHKTSALIRASSSVVRNPASIASGSVPSATLPMTRIVARPHCRVRVKR